jgi:hypothetical protein
MPPCGTWIGYDRWYHSAEQARFDYLVFRQAGGDAVVMFRHRAVQSHIYGRDHAYDCTVPLLIGVCVSRRGSGVLADRGPWHYAGRGR